MLAGIRAKKDERGGEVGPANWYEDGLSSDLRERKAAPQGHRIFQADPIREKENLP